ncbi:MAG: DUF805 domain-containing protein [Pseudomonadota bacterium]
MAMMSPAEAVARCLANYATFSGRASRPEFWWFIGFVILGNLAFGFLDSALGFESLGQLPEHMRAQEGFDPLFEYEAPSPLAAIFALATLLPQLAAGARRLHDRDMSAWWLLALLLPIAGALLLLIFMAMPGSEDENSYGPRPAA